MKPITFRTDMVKAILDGRKSQTRRIIKPQPEIQLLPCGTGKKYWAYDPLGINPYFHHNYGMIGDILYVKETWCYETDMGGSNNGWYFYKADFEEHEGPTKWKSSRFMPQAAARIFLEITDVRVERLNDINENDAIAEGIVMNNEPHKGWYWMKDVYCTDSAEVAYEKLWESINGKGSWNLNPWVWVISFRRVEK